MVMLMQLSVLFINTSTHLTKFSPKLKRLNAQTMYSFDIVFKALITWAGFPKVLK